MKRTGLQKKDGQPPFSAAIVNPTLDDQDEDPVHIYSI